MVNIYLLMNLIKKTITRLSHTAFYKKIKIFLKNAINRGSVKNRQEINIQVIPPWRDSWRILKNAIRIFSIPSILKAIWFFLKNIIYMNYKNDFLKNIINMKYKNEFLKIMYSILDRYKPWNIDYLQFTDNFLEIRGWAITQQNNKFLVSFTINNEDFDQIEYPYLREDIRRLFWYYPQSEKSGFFCRTKLTKEEAFANGHIVFKYINNKTKQTINDNHNVYYYKDNLALPDAKRMKRVIGTENKLLFRINGYTIYVKLELVLKNTFNKSYSDFSNILDWGCGCGRITRYFKNIKNTAITGVDIDSDNINWCNKYLGFGNFLNIPLHPPTSLEDTYFDLIIGISVFTHLGEKEQYKWLSELQRVSSDDAILLVSVQSEANIYNANFNLSTYNLWKKKGIYIFNIPNHEINYLIEETDYYKSTFHTQDYIIKNWSKYFEIVDIIPAYIGNVQDLIVMRKV